MGPKSYTTDEAAEKVGVTRATLQAWIKGGHVQRVPEIRARSGKSPVRLWSMSDIARLKAVKKEMEEKKKVGRPRKRG